MGRGGERERGQREEEKNKKRVENMILDSQTLAQLWFCAIHVAQLRHFVSQKPIATHGLLTWEPNMGSQIKLNIIMTTRGTFAMVTSHDASAITSWSQLTSALLLTCNV